MPTTEPKLNGSLEIRKAASDERLEVFAVVERAYLAELAWGLLSTERIKELKDVILKGMEGKDLEVLVIEDGRRIVGASVILPDAGSPRQLVSGVCMLEEYRCRGSATGLLWRSLKLLAEKELVTASVVTRSNLPACKFLYPKFDSRRERIEELPVLKQFA